MRWCFAALCEEVEVFEHSSFGSERSEISELLTLNICLIFWTFLVELAYCEPPPDTQRWCDGALLLRVRRRRFLSALLLVLSARARFLYSVAYYDLRLKRSSSGRCWAARAKRLLCYWILDINADFSGRTLVNFTVMIILLKNILTFGLMYISGQGVQNRHRVF